MDKGLEPVDPITIETWTTPHIPQIPAAYALWPSLLNRPVLLLFRWGPIITKSWSAVELLPASLATGSVQHVAKSESDEPVAPWNCVWNVS